MTGHIFQILAAFFIGLCLVYYAIPIIVQISIAKHLYDVPNERKVNKTVIPNLGGIALFVGISIGTLIGIFKGSFSDWRYISAAMIILFFVGIKDDILVISARKKFAAQILSALILTVLGDIRITNFHGMLGINEINYALSISFSLLTIVGIINALNLIDGIDGLAASIGILASTIFGFIFFFSGEISYAVLSFATSGSLLAFYYFNVYGKKNKVFMGDTGSLILGLVLSISAIRFTELTTIGNEVFYSVSPVLALAILAVPVFDMIRIFSMRILHRKSPFSPDMNHIHHKFLKLDLTHRTTTQIIVISNIIIIGMVYVFRNLNNHLLLMLLISMVSILMILPKFIYEYIKSKNSIAKKMQMRSYLIPYKNEFIPKAQRETPKTIIYLNDLAFKANKLKKTSKV